jgi:hypothetical protein
MSGCVYVLLHMYITMHGSKNLRYISFVSWVDFDIRVDDRMFKKYVAWGMSAQVVACGSR